MVPVFKHTHEASIPHIHSLRGNIPLALGNRHHLRSGFSTFPLAFGNAYRPTTTFRPSLTRSMSELAILQQLRRAHFHQVLNIVSADALCLLHLPSLLSIECGEPALKSTRRWQQYWRCTTQNKRSDSSPECASEGSSGCVVALSYTGARETVLLCSHRRFGRKTTGPALCSE
jgi:hypothetical protein